jgi:hypothetical protein
MQFGSSHPSLFSTGCADPREYVGAPVPRRAMSSHGHRPTSPQYARPSTSVKLRPPGQQVRNGMLDDGVGAVSLLNMDVHREFNPKYAHLTSPRSIKACRTLGLTPGDLMTVTLDDCVKKMTSNGEDVTDPHVVQKRHEYWSLRRDQKFESARQERDRLCSSDEHHAAPSRVGVSSNVLAQKQQLQKIIDANANRLKQQLLHQEVLQRQREKEEDNRRQQRLADEEAREQQRQLELQKARKEEEAQHLRAEVKELQRQEAATVIDMKRAEAERKDITLRDRLMRKRLVAEAKNEAKRERNATRRGAMREQAEVVAAHRRSTFEARWEQFKDSQDEFARRREEASRLRAIEGDRKREKIERTKQRCDEVLHAKIHRTQQREERAEAMLREHAQARDEELAEKAELDELRAAEREVVFQAAQQQHQARVWRLTEKIDAAQEHMRQLQAQLDTERRLRRETQRESELDKRDCVTRRQKADEHRRALLESKLEDKRQRVERMKEQQVELMRRHKDLREEAERSRVHVLNPTPGPSDYDTIPRVKEGSKWKFGLPAAVLAARQVAKDYPAPGYDASPGPCNYSMPLKPHTPQFSLCRTERWHQPSEMHATPGPSDYAPDSVVVSPSRHSPSGLSPARH